MNHKALPATLLMLATIAWTPVSLAQDSSGPWRADLVGIAETDYLIGIEDVLRIAVWGEEELSLSVFVRPDGKVTFPLVNDIPVAGLTPDQVRHAVADKLGAYIREPNVTVIVEEIRSFPVFVLGRVNSQGVLTFNRPTRILQALAAAGGFAEFSKKQIVVLRYSGETEQRLPINYKKLLAGDPAEENIYLQPGDTLLVD